MNEISVCLATIPPRAEHLTKALASVARQSMQPAAIIVEYDHCKTGAAETKNRAIARVTSEWTAMLDDDDEFMPHHLRTHLDCALETGADVVYSIPHIPQIPGGRDENLRPGQPFDAEELRRRSYIQTTVLVRTEMIQRSGGFRFPPGSPYDDWGAMLGLLDIGAKFVHLPEQTFIWNHWGYGTPGNPGNTSGHPTRW